MSDLQTILDQASKAYEETKPASMDTEKLMSESRQLTLMMALREGPRDGNDQLGMAQAYAILAVANELKRMNDRIEAEIDRDEILAGR